MTPLASVSTSSAAPTYGNPPVQRSAQVRRHHDSDGDDAPKAERREGPGRRNPLVAAMMSALSSLVPANTTTTSGTPAATPDTAATPVATTTTPAPATPTSTPATTPPSADPATTLREAAYAFAHALYSALRGDDDGGERRGHGHHHHHGHRGGGYGDLAERLSALANRLEAGSSTPTPTTTPVPPTATATPPATDPAPVVVTPTPEPEPETDSAGSGNINITINVNINIGTAQATPATPAAETPSNPLVDAFRKLLTALGADSGSTASPTERLTTFLRQMAESLSGDKSTTPATPTSGGLLNVSA